MDEYENRSELIKAKDLVIETFCGRLEDEQKYRCMMLYEEWVQNEQAQRQSEAKE